jgi:hypothetical protein
MSTTPSFAQFASGILLALLRSRVFIFLLHQLKELGMNDQEVYASCHAAARIGFYIHLLIYGLVTVFLFGIAIMHSPSTYWVEFPLLGWGLGILTHGFIVFVLSRSLVEEPLAVDNSNRHPESKKV